MNLQTSSLDFDLNFATADFNQLLADRKIHPVTQENIRCLVKFLELLATPADQPTPAELRKHLIQTYPLDKSPQGIVADEQINTEIMYLLKALKAGQVYVKFTNTPENALMYSGKTNIVDGLRALGHPRVCAVWLLPNNLNMQAAEDNVSLLHKLLTQGLLLAKGVQEYRPGKDPLALRPSQFRSIRLLAGQLMYLFWLGKHVNTFGAYPTEDMILYLLSKVARPIRNGIANTLVKLDRQAAREYQSRDSVAVLSMLITLRESRPEATRLNLLSLANKYTASSDYDGHIFQILDGFLANSAAKSA